MGATRILIVDDHPLFREALKQAISGGVANASVSLAASLDAATAILGKEDDYDLILLDLRMPGVQGLSGLIYLRAQYPNVPVVIITAADDHGLVQKALNLNAAGFIPKTSGIETIIAAVNTVLKGDIWAPDGYAQPSTADKEGEDIARRVATLTAQQIRVLMMLKEGLLNKQIAYELNVSEATIKAHVSAILQKLNVSSRTQAVIAASRIDGVQAEH
ncbi:response regulator [Aestuariivirga sp.]|jgi:DNA-binding NarL/FixJ family response regulator|uniref:response regulator n=1 Tax=Aestuariivirga sp. TaxID=2650926 RepID=UPI003784B0D8